MGIIEGLPKYVIFTPLTVVGFVSMYLFGEAIITFLNTAHNLLSGNFIEAFVEYYITSALPPTSVLDVVSHTLLGSIVAGIKWFFAMFIRGAAL